MHRAGDGEHDGLVHLAQEWRDQLGCRNGVARRASPIDSWDQAMDPTDRRRRIGDKLALAFVTRGTDHRPRAGDGTVLLGNPGVQRGAWRGKRVPFVHSERMGRVDERYAEFGFHLARDIGRIGKMRVDHVRQPLTAPQIGDKRSGEPFAIGTQRFLRQIAPVAAVDAADQELRSNPFLFKGMRRAEPRVVETPRYDFGQRDIVAAGECVHLAQDISDVPPRIFRDPVPDRLCLEAAAECERYDMQDKSPWWLLSPNVGTTASASRPINI